jgi:LacI family transcriptional regulator
MNVTRTIMNKPRITLADIAEAADVSKMTVSRVLNNKSGVSDETRQRIWLAAEHLGYELQSSAPLDGSFLIALLIHNQPSIYHAELLRGISAAAEKLNCGLMLYTQNMFNTATHPDNNLSPLRTGLIDGVLMVVARDFEAMVAGCNRYDLPFVILDHRSEAPNEASVTATNRKGMLEATRYLSALGHQRIGFITGRMDIACSHDRLQGYRDALIEVGLPFEEELVMQGDFLQPSGFQQAKALLELKHRPTAIIASNDLMAFGAMEAARVAGLIIGQDVSIIGFDDIYISSQTYPPLTSVRQPLSEMGETALDMLISIIQGRKLLSRRRELPTELMVRESTGRAPR